MKPSLRGVLFLTVAGGLLFSQGVDGAVLARYSFGSPGQETTAETGPAYAASTVHANLLATSVSDPAGTVGLQINSTAPAPVSAPFLRVDPQAVVSNIDAAIANNKYFTITFTPGDGFEMDLASLAFNVMRDGATVPRGYGVRSSADNYASTLSTAVVGTTKPTFTPVSVDLSAAAFQDRTDPLTFRFYVFGPGSGSAVDFDDIVLNGTVVAMPEPVSLTTLTLGAAALLRRRRRA